MPVFFSLVDRLSNNGQTVIKEGHDPGPRLRRPLASSTQMIQEWDDKTRPSIGSIQSCCYVFEIDELSLLDEADELETSLDYYDKYVTSIAEIPNPAVLKRQQRCTIYGYCICMANINGVLSPDRCALELHVYPVDVRDFSSRSQSQSTAVGPFLKLSCRHGFHIPSFVLSKLEHGGDLMKFEDILVASSSQQGKPGEAFLDKYSRVTLCCSKIEDVVDSMDILFQVDNLSVCNAIPVSMERPVLCLCDLVDENEVIGSLVNITGRICGVNEEKASLLTVCGNCGESNFKDEDDNYCLACDMAVTTSTAIELEIFIHVPALHHCIVAVEVLQHTALSLLPSLSSSQAEGLDVNCILQKRITRLPCVVRGNSTRQTQRGVVRFISLNNVNLLLKQAPL